MTVATTLQDRRGACRTLPRWRRYEDAAQGRSPNAAGRLAHHQRRDPVDRRACVNDRPDGEPTNGPPPMRPRARACSWWTKATRKNDEAYVLDITSDILAAVDWHISQGYSGEEFLFSKSSAFPRYIDSHVRPLRLVQERLELRLLSHHKVGRRSVASQAVTGGESVKAVLASHTATPGVNGRRKPPAPPNNRSKDAPISQGLFDLLRGGATTRRQLGLRCRLRCGWRSRSSCSFSGARFAHALSCETAATCVDFSQCALGRLRAPTPEAWLASREAGVTAPRRFR